MVKRYIPGKGDIYWVDPHPTEGREMKNMHPYVVITPKEINQLGVSMTVPVASGGKFLRERGLVVPLSGSQTSGVAACNQIRSFDLEERVKQGSAKYIETLDQVMVNLIIDRIISVIEPME